MIKSKISVRLYHAFDTCINFIPYPCFYTRLAISKYGTKLIKKDQEDIFTNIKEHYKHDKFGGLKHTS